MNNKYILSRYTGLTIIILSLMFSVITPNSSALNFTFDYLGGNPSTDTVGGGNLVDIFEAAASRWEDVITDPFTVKLHFGWAMISAGGTHWLNSQGGTLVKEVSDAREKKLSYSLHNDLADKGTDYCGFQY